MRRLLLILAILSCAACAPAATPDSMESARAYCDSTASGSIEGIWQYPDQSLTVLAHKSATHSGSYTLTAISASDASVVPGQEIGTITPSSKADTYTLSIYTRRKGLKLTSKIDYTAILADGGYSLTLNRPGITLRINPLGLLPFVRNLVRLQVEDPRHQVLKGMVKIYPGYDHEGSLPGHPRYL